MNYLRCLQHYGTVIQVMLEHSVRRVEHKMDCYQIQGHAAESGPETTAHTVLGVQQILACNNMAVISHFLYLPNLAPCDSFPFPNMKMQLKEQRSDAVEKGQAESQAMLTTLTRKGFQDCCKS